MLSIRNTILVLFFLLSITPFLMAQIRLPAVFSSNMVIQRNTEIPIWGWAGPTQTIQILVSWDSTIVQTKVSNTSLWKATIKTPSANGPHTITIKAGSEQKTIENVMSGEVWLCSGQSNMEWSMNLSADGKPYLEKINDPQIRLFQVPRSAASTPQMKGEGNWNHCNGESLKWFSAVAYYFGKTLNTELKVPIGLIHSSWGGTPAEVWIPKEIIDSDSLLKANANKQCTIDRPWCPSVSGMAYNSMIAPLIPFKLSGIIWYQGESNVEHPYSYKQLMEKLILNWRKDFQSELPFYYVQIAPYSGYGDNLNGVLLREQQSKLLKVPNTGMVIISDVVGNINDIHPPHKKPVGERLALLALEDTYNIKTKSAKSPSFKSMKIENGKIKITFDNASKGLTTKEGQELNGFIIAGSDKLFYPAKAEIKDNTVTVYSPKVTKPVAARFEWTNDAIPNLFNKDGLPVSSFRTDEW
ncbi:MAG: sialate O-acetylesterase [Sporocytophaga sp.]|uniref:sialate O-acetylesterase n=1 Tax=Sporocytophaga sp. TaxID=2231183 RepID=UPI001B0711C0|nr:sialate O-acetylesterase [Sporocytophaga sp.]MBO9700950.1 sialate O-acetylesterase [Sporocytophaga sp.]